MARTRSTKGPTAKEKADAKADKAKTAATSSSSSSIYTLAPETANPPLFFILPKAATPEARIVTLHNPRYAKPSRYLVCPSTGFFEFNKISPPKGVPRSWLLESNVRIQGGDQPKEEGDTPPLESQIFDSPDLFIATPIDPLFLVLPALAATDAKNPQKKRMFLASDDHLDTLSELCGSGGHLSEVLTWPASRALLEARIAAVSDSVEAGDDQMYRLSEAKLLDEILAKAWRMSDKGLPRSLEEKFVTKVLEAPILGIRSQVVPVKVVVKEGGDSPTPEAGDTQSTVSSVATASSSLSEASTAATSVSGDAAAGGETVENAVTAPEEVLRLQRLRTAFNFICASYVAPGLASTLKRMLPTSEAVDFAPLDEYMAKLTKLCQEAAAVRTGDYSRKRGCEEEADERAEKRRKQEAEDKIKKANQSRGVKSLAKVNTAGMKKMSDFFKKK